MLDCFNPNIQYIVEHEKEPIEIAEYTTKDGREVLIKQIMRYESKTQINRIEWHYFINGEFDSVQNLDMRLFFPQELDSYLEWNGFEFFISLAVLKKKHFVIIRKNRYLFANELLLTDGGILIFDIFSEGIIDDRQESRIGNMPLAVGSGMKVNIYF